MLSAPGPCSPTSGHNVLMSGWFKAALAVAWRPYLWVESLRFLGAVAAPGWWRRPPFLPVPEPGYLRWRIATAYGSADHPVRPDDLVALLRWRAELRRSRRLGPSG
jgi:hypothetical protein